MQFNDRRNLALRWTGKLITEVKVTTRMCNAKNFPNPFGNIGVPRPHWPISADEGKEVMGSCYR